MKIAGVGRRNKPNCGVLWALQAYSTRGWVYREGQGWVFAELTPDELAEFQSYTCGKITIPRMKVRLPYSRPIVFFMPEQHELERYSNWFVRCSTFQAPSQILSRFHLHQKINNRPTQYASEPDSYETWLWNDEVRMCQELGCKVTFYGGYAWSEWGVPPEWKAPLPYKGRTFIYAIVNELAHEAYVGQTDNVDRRWIEHLRDTKNSGKVALLQNIRVQGFEPKPIQLEEVPGEKANERERYWTAYYKSQGYKIINRDYRRLSWVNGDASIE